VPNQYQTFPYLPHHHYVIHHHNHHQLHHRHHHHHHLLQKEHHHQQQQHHLLQIDDSQLVMHVQVVGNHEGSRLSLDTNRSNQSNWYITNKHLHHRSQLHSQRSSFGLANNYSHYAHSYSVPVVAVSQSTTKSYFIITGILHVSDIARLRPPTTTCSR
jgi:hypothetical protein